MPSLNSFGSILTFAINLEASLKDYYDTVGDADRAKDADKRRSNLERVRREHVLEITLEPIDGLDEADYAVDFSSTSTSGQQTVERVAAQFYEDVAPKINVREAQRVLTKYAKQHAELSSD